MALNLEKKKNKAKKNERISVEWLISQITKSSLEMFKCF